MLQVSNPLRSSFEKAHAIDEVIVLLPSRPKNTWWL